MITKKNRNFFVLGIFGLVFLSMLLVPAKLQATTLVTIPDTNLRHMIKPTGEITVEYMENLKKFEISNLPITSLEGLQYAKNIEYLSILNCGVTNISPLQGLTKLEELHLSNNKVSDISPLSTLSNLRVVDLKNNQIQDISSLNKINEINSLILSGNKIKNIDGLSGMKHLIKLSLNDNQLQDISSIKLIINNNGFTSDASVDLSDNYFNLGPESQAMVTIDALKAKKITVAYEPQKWIQVKINNNYLTMDVSPTVIDGRTMVPMRAIFEALGATVTYDSLNRKIIGTKGDKKVVLTANVKVAEINGKYVAMDVPPTIVDGRTLVPVRLIAEAMGKNVEWNAELKTVLIKD